MTGEFAIAVHALVYLNHKKAALSSEEIAENVCTHPARVRKVLAKLKQAELVEAKEGLGGGYEFRLDPSEVTLCHINKAVDKRLVSAAWRSGDSSMECLVASGMANIMDDIYERLDTVCRSELQHITLEDIDRMIFGGKGADNKDETI